MLEVSDSRIQDSNKRIIDEAADNASAGACVLGRELTLSCCTDVEGLCINLRAGDEILITTQATEDIFAWLSRLFVKMIAWGRPMLAGDIIAAGAMATPVSITGDTYYSADFEHLGTVSTRIV